MTVIELRDFLIVRGIKEVKEKYADQPSKLLGAIQGFELCRNLETPEQFQKEIRKREESEHKWITDHSRKEIKGMSEYWKYRYATLQIEFVYERLKVGWKIQPWSTKAVLDYAKIVGIKGE